MSTEPVQPDETVAADAAPAPADPAEAPAPEAVHEEPTVALFTADPRDQQIADLEAQLEELQGRLRAVSNAYKQNQDEIAATRARLERNMAVREELRRGEVVQELFEPVQNLKRSLEAAKRGATLEDTTKGVDMVFHQFMDGFKKLGLEPVPGKGARFDPNLHEALTSMPVTDAALDDVVMEVFAEGYRIGSRLIAPAKVIVGKFQPATGEA